MPRNRPTKKVILLIVEGPSDENSLSLVLEGLITNERVIFEIVYGDILTDRDISETSVLRRVRQFVEHLTNVRKFCGPKDISQIVQLIDTDGAFIPEECITENAKCRIQYTLERIETWDVESIKKRNLQKSRIARKLIDSKVITFSRHPIPYSIYFFSRNLEHVLHGIPNELDNKAKQQLSEMFEDKYANDSIGFLQLICSPEIGAEGDYKESWINITEGTNSLKRKTNLNLFLCEYLKRKTWQ